MLQGGQFATIFHPVKELFLMHLVSNMNTFAFRSTYSILLIKDYIAAIQRHI
jgi:hypothetical protein